VSNTTIINCWRTTGILSNIVSTDLSNNNDELENNELEDNEFEDNIFNNEKYETIDLTNPTKIELINNIKSYCDIIDMPLLTEDMMNDDEIFTAVHANFDPKPVIIDSEEENEEPAMSSVSLSEALNALHILIQFQEQQNDNNKFKSEEL
jgi:hypothetical protein